MTGFPKHIYADLAAVVGERNLSDDPAFLASHDWNGLGAMPSDRSLLGNPPGVVVMPASTEEVAGIIKACKRHDIRFKAHSTGHGNYSGVGSKGSVSIDLRRMNKLEIDAKNRMAIVQPYVTAGQLMSEAFQRNLICHVVGAGPVHSPLASASAYMGVGVLGNHTSNNVRNLLSLEWVTPDGEIVRIGSSGSDAGWFTGEGPGPGFRGMLRGIVGSAGGLGVFTQIGYKLYPWADDKALTWVGEHPGRGIKLPDNFSFHQLHWPTWEAMMEATYMMQKAKIPTLITRTPPSAIGMMVTATNREYYERYEAGTLPPIARKEKAVSWSVVLMSWSPCELAWKQDVLKSILARTGGEDLVIDPQDAAILAANSVTSLYVARFLRMGGVAGVTTGIMDSVGMIPKLMQRSDALIGNAGKPGGQLLEIETEQNWMWLSEGRHLWSENNPAGNRYNPRSIGVALYVMMRSFFWNEKDPIGFAAFVQGEATVDLFGPGYNHVQKWMRRVKNMFDPDDRSDSVHFIAPRRDGLSKIWPAAKLVLFRSWFGPIFRHLLSKM